MSFHLFEMTGSTFMLFIFRLHLTLNCYTKLPILQIDSNYNAKCFRLYRSLGHIKRDLKRI